MLCPRPHSALRTPHSAPQCGFTLVELLTVIAIIAVLATLLTSALAGAKLRSQQALCMGNLRQVALAVEMYHDDTTRRPRTVTRLTERPTWLGNPRALLCPSDPALKNPAAAAGRRGTNAPVQMWGNLANASQEPWLEPHQREAESGSWQTELLELEEKVSFSYLHPLAWNRPAWQRLLAVGGQMGTAVCQLHGIKVPGGPQSSVARPFMNYEGQFFRAQRDGAVVPRKIFRTPGDSPITTAPARESDYPWEFYVDSVPPIR